MSSPIPKSPAGKTPIFTDDLMNLATAETIAEVKANPSGRGFLDRLYAIADALYGIPQMGKKNKKHLPDF